MTDEYVMIRREIIERLTKPIKSNEFVATLNELRSALSTPAPVQQTVVVTRNAQGQILAVTRQDDEHRILSVIAEADTAAAPAPANSEIPNNPWVEVSEQLPQIKQILSEKCTLEGRELPTLYRSGEVIWYDGKRVSAGVVEWFHGKSPLSGVTHWMPLPPAPEIARLNSKKEGGSHE